MPFMGNIDQKIDYECVDGLITEKCKFSYQLSTNRLLDPCNSLGIRANAGTFCLGSFQFQARETKL